MFVLTGSKLSTKAVLLSGEFSLGSWGTWILLLPVLFF